MFAALSDAFVSGRISSFWIAEPKPYGKIVVADIVATSLPGSFVSSERLCEQFMVDTVSPITFNLGCRQPILAHLSSDLV